MNIMMRTKMRRHAVDCLLVAGQMWIGGMSFSEGSFLSGNVIGRTSWEFYYLNDG